MITDSKRSCLYCENITCVEYAKAAFLYAPCKQAELKCRHCGLLGKVVSERGIRQCRPGQIYGEVRIEYCYDPTRDIYREIAIVRDDALDSSAGIFTFQSPLIRTQKRALRLAEMFLASLNEDVQEDQEIPAVKEWVLDLDNTREHFFQRVQSLGNSLRENKFFRKGGVFSRVREEGIREKANEEES